MSLARASCGGGACAAPMGFGRAPRHARPKTRDSECDRTPFLRVASGESAPGGRVAEPESDQRWRGRLRTLGLGATANRPAPQPASRHGACVRRTKTTRGRRPPARFDPLSLPALRGVAGRGADSGRRARRAAGSRKSRGIKLVLI